MNIINEITTKVVYIEYDDKKDCYLASIDKSVPVPVWNRNSIQYQNVGSIYIELATVDCSNIAVGDTITIKTIERQPGEQIELFGGEYHTFATGGISNIITGISSAKRRITKAIGIFAIDSYHMVGGHFPSIRTTNIYDSIDDCLNMLMTSVDSFEIEDANHKRITREDIEHEISVSKYHEATIHFQYPREGQVTIIFED